MTYSPRPRRYHKALFFLGPCAAILAACSSDVAVTPSPTAAPDAGPSTGITDAIPVVPGDGNEDLASLPYAPHFEPDYNHLVAQPWVEPVTAAQQDEVVVTPSSLIFIAANHPEVRVWEAGRVVASAPGSAHSLGVNPLGFARRVVSQSEADGKITVLTRSVGLEDLVSGDFQATYDAAQSQDVDLSKLDLDWAIANLYTNDAPAYEPGEPLLDDYALSIDSTTGAPFWGSIGRFVSGAAKAVGNAVTNAVAAITPKSFEGSVSISPTMSGGTSMPLFSNMNYKKQLKGGKYPIELFIKGSASMAANVAVSPGFQVGATIPNIINKNAPPFAAWMNIDAKSQVKVDLDVDLEAGVSSAGGEASSALENKLSTAGDFAQDVLGRTRESLLGDPDMKPAGGWRKPVYISTPSTRIIMAGPVPVVIVSTVQVDVECGFEAKASIKGKIRFEQAQTFKFGARYEKGGSATVDSPKFDKRTVRTVELTGGGSLSVTCGLIPRINTMLYDTAGLNVGLRGSLVAKAAYESSCAENTTTPKAEVAVGLYGNVGVQVGGRLQAPGSSFLGTSGQKAGFDIGPFEPWNTQFPIFEKTWELDKGFGYCTPTCKNGTKDNAETDKDCGGGACQTCAAGKVCRVSSDCAGGASCSGGKCKAAPCADGVISGAESDIDCGGTCSAKCANGKYCSKAADCASGSCNRSAATGAGVCVPDHCSDKVRNADESGTDCGGATCGKCATGSTSAIAADCASGISDGTFCVASTCSDHAVTAGESDQDCGGASSCRRCGVGQACTAHSDCSKGPYALLCIENKCSRPTAVGCDDRAWTGDETDVDCGGACGATCQNTQACQSGGDCVSGNCAGGKCVECVSASQCASGVCAANACAAPSCTDTVKNGTETDTDCGGSCTTKCADAKVCLAGTDCASGLCTAGVCAPSGSCSDGIKNGSETDVDCGGACGQVCKVSQVCTVNADCYSTLCTAGECRPRVDAGDAIVFVSSGMYTGDLGGVAGADAKCQGLADATSLGGTYKAFLADGTANASARMSVRPGAYKNVNGTVIAASSAGFFSSSHTSGVLEEETGAPNGGEMWTGLTSATGGGAGCSGWTSTAGTTPCGGSGETNGRWLMMYSQFCNRGNLRLYCVQQ